MTDTEPAELARRVAEAVRRACVRAARDGYESASISGLCAEGAAEAAVDAVRMLDLDAVLREVLAGGAGSPAGGAGA